MAKSSAQPILLGLFALVLVGFLVKVVWHRPLPPPENLQPPAAETYALSDKIDIDVYLDTSGSIKNFLQEARPAKGGADAAMNAEPRFNYLRDLMNKCYPALKRAPGARETNTPGTSGWNDTAVRFWKFGDKVEELPGIDGMQREIDRPGDFKAQHTRIENAVKDTPEPSRKDDRAELKIIITDLYESGGAVEKPAEELARKYLSDDNNGAVGILGVRNPLNGEVEDLPGTQPNEVLHNAADTMPFYVIVAGPAPDVHHAMDTLLEHAGLKDAQSSGLLQLFFSRKPAPPAARLPVIEGTDYNPMSDNYEGQNISMIGLPQTGKVTVRWSGGARDETNGTVDLGAGYQLIPSAVSFDQQGKLTNSPEAASAATPCAPAICAVIDGSKLTKGTVYRIQLDRVASDVAGILEPGSDMMKSWNIERQEAERISHGTRQFPNDPKLKGKAGKTPDLSKFFLPLQGAMFHSRLRTDSYYLYVQAD